MYIYYVYINTHTCMYIFEKKSNLYILIFINDINYMNINIYCMCVYLYIHNDIHRTHILSQSLVELHCISQHPSGHSPALRHNHSHLTSIRESSSPVATNQALNITALNPDTHCLVSRLQALHHIHAGSLLICGDLPPDDSTKGRDKDY